MFPPRLLRGIDLAIGFATLGEYGLEPAPEAPAPALAFRVDLSGIGGSTQRCASRRLAPATAAARQLRDATVTRVVAQPRSRRRGGAARPRPQPCLLADHKQRA
ncbi:MAG: hypothetical protein ACJ768_23075 [Gaiellaceae bacterium]